MTRKTCLSLFVAAIALSAPAHALTNFCDRTPQIRDYVAGTFRKACADVTEADLETVKRIAVSRRGITALKVTDFDDMPNLEIINLVGNKVSVIPEGIFAKLPNLKTLVLFNNPIRTLPDDFLENNPKLENWHMHVNPIKTISESVFSRLEAMHNFKEIDLPMTLNAPERTRLRKLFPEGGKTSLTFY